MCDLGAVCWFLLRGENRRTRRKTLEAEKRTNTNSTQLWRRVWESNLSHIGGRRVLSPLRHPCWTHYFKNNIIIIIVCLSLLRSGTKRDFCRLSFPKEMTPNPLTCLSSIRVPCRRLCVQLWPDPHSGSL